MNKEKKDSLFARTVHMIKKIFFSILKILYVIPFFIFGLWLLSAVYFPGLDLKASITLSKYRKDHDVLTTAIQKKEEVPRDHFHMIDAYVERRAEKPPICVVCHGAYAHGKEKKVRALLNLHTGFISCSVCHVRKDGGDAEAAAPGDKISAFLWRDRETGDFKKTVKGEYGKYPATIFPVTVNEQGVREILTPITEEAARRFLQERPGLTQEQLDVAREKLHAAISKEAVSCADCHKKDGYLDFIQLGFPRQRVDHLISSEFVGMIDKYKTFYLPSVIDFRGEPEVK